MTSTDQPTPDDLLKVVAETQVIKKVPGKVAPVGRYLRTRIPLCN